MLKKALRHLRLYESGQILVPGLMGIIAAGSLPRPALLAAYFASYFSHLLSVYSYNDYCDLDLDSQNPRKSREGSRRDPVWLRNQTLALVLIFVASLALLPTPVGLIFVANQVLCMAYSAPRVRLKGRLFGSEVAHFFAGSTYFMSGVMVASGRAMEHWMPAVLFGLLYLSGGTFNEIMDCEADREAGLRHLVVRLGKRRAFPIVVSAHAFALLLVALYDSSTAILFLTGAASIGYLFALARLSRDSAAGSLVRFRQSYRLLFAALLVALGVSRALGTLEPRLGLQGRGGAQHEQR